MPRLSPDDESNVVDQYSRGEEVRVIAASIGISPQTVFNVLRRKGVTLRGERVRRDVDLVIDAAVRGDTLERASKMLGVSRSTVTRRLRERRAEGEGAVVRRGRPSRSTRTLEPSDDFETARLLLAAFPYPEMLSREDASIEFGKLRGLSVFVDENVVIRPQSLVGLRLCAPFFPNRFEAKSKGCPSALDAWRSESEVRKAVLFQRRYGDPITPKRVLRAITLRCRTPTIFRPAVAKLICTRYASPGAIAWDPCAGYGGRLLGAAAAGVRYIATEVDAQTVDGNERLARAVGADVVIHRCPAESFAPPEVDLVFTSPPYFDREKYSDAEDQSWKKHGTRFERWVEGFLRPVIVRAHGALRERRHLVLNVADLRERGRLIPLADRTIAVARETGFEHVETLLMPLASVNRGAVTEPVLVFTKKGPCPR